MNEDIIHSPEKIIVRRSSTDVVDPNIRHIGKPPRILCRANDFKLYGIAEFRQYSLKGHFEYPDVRLMRYMYDNNSYAPKHWNR